MKLIIINGPCGVGKSTVARALHATMPLSYLLDVDQITRNISQYRKYHDEHRRLRDILALANVEALMKHGTDTIIEKMMPNQDIIDAYYEVAQKYGAQVVEIILWAEKEEVLRRKAEFGYPEGGMLTPERTAELWYKIDTLKDRRANAYVIDVTKMNEKQVLASVSEKIQAN